MVTEYEGDYIGFNGDSHAFTRDEWYELQDKRHAKFVKKYPKNREKTESRQLVNSTAQPTPNALIVLPNDTKGSLDLAPSEALIRAREACIAGQYVVGLDAEMQVRAGMHDDWLPLQIAYNALITKDIDVDVLRKYHAPGQLALAKAEQRPVIVRERRNPWNVLLTQIAWWFNRRSRKTNMTDQVRARIKAKQVEFKKEHQVLLEEHRKRIDAISAKVAKSYGTLQKSKFDDQFGRY